MKYVASYSGGKDSTAMLILIKENELPLDEIVYVDVGDWMWSELEDHHKKVEKFMGMDITRIDISEQIKENFEKYGFPSYFVRWCTGLKRETINKYLSKYRKEGLKQYVGIAADEAKRTENKMYRKNEPLFPLIDFEYTEEDALNLCYQKGFDFARLYHHRSRMNCWCCPLQKKGELKYLFENYPERWEKLREMQHHSDKAFRMWDQSIFQIEHDLWDEAHSHRNQRKEKVLEAEHGA